MSPIIYTAGPRNQWLDGLRSKGRVENTVAPKPPSQLGPPESASLVVVAHSVRLEDNWVEAIPEEWRGSIILRVLLSGDFHGAKEVPEATPRTWKVAPDLLVDHFEAFDRYVNSVPLTEWKADGWLAWPETLVALYLFARAVELADEWENEELKSKLVQGGDAGLDLSTLVTEAKEEAKVWDLTPSDDSETRPLNSLETFTQNPTAIRQRIEEWLRRARH